MILLPLRVWRYAIQKVEYTDNTRYGWDEQTLSFTPVNQVDLLKVYGPILEVT